MNPALIQLAILVIEEAMKQGPALVADMKAVFAKGNPTPEDFAALRAKVAAEDYFKFVPQSDLPGNVTKIPVQTPSEPAVPAPAVPTVEAAAPAAAAVTPTSPSDAPTPAPASATALEVKCPKCGQVLIPDSLDNCNC